MRLSLRAGYDCSKVATCGECKSVWPCPVEEEHEHPVILGECKNCGD